MTKKKPYSRRRVRQRINGLTGENALGKPAIVLTMNIKSLKYVTKLLTCGRIAVEWADAQKKKPFHD